MIDVICVVLFLFLVNGLPPLAAIIVRDRYSFPVDGGALWFDQRPIFGSHKTIRGIAAGITGGFLAAPLLEVTWSAAATAALLAMTGDLFSSFIKRRAAIDPGEEAIFLDQIFEALFPLLSLNQYLLLDLKQNIIILVIFITAAYWSSRLWLHITARPLPEKYPRVVRSSVRFREWRACHEPLARWQTWFNLTSFLSHQLLLTWLFKLTGLYAKGVRNAQEIKIEEKKFFFDHLPTPFDGFRIVFLTDLHLDGLDNLAQRIAEKLAGVDFNLCCIGGDIRMKTYGPSSECISNLKYLMHQLRAGSGALGVLGNHDCIEMLPGFEEAGVVMLVNDSWYLEKDEARIWIMGVDDPHYYKLHDAQQAAKEVPRDAFSIFLAHSPEAYKDAAGVNASLYLCGHTHGGQVCLANGTPVLTNSRAPRATAAGDWQYEKMRGYTSRGVGASGIPVRFNCPGEITIITLKRSKSATAV